MPEGESQVGLVDIFNGNSNLRENMDPHEDRRARAERPARPRPLWLGKGRAQLSVG